jgi:hypothetical protein
MVTPAPESPDVELAAGHVRARAPHQRGPRAAAAAFAAPPAGMKAAHAHAPAAAPRRGRAAVLALTAVDVTLLLVLARVFRVAGRRERDLLFLYYQPFAPLLGMLWLWAGNVAVFEARGLRYDACFSAEDARRLPPARTLFGLAAALSAGALASAAAFLLAAVVGRDELAAAQPPLAYGAFLVALLAPRPAPLADARRLFAATLWRVATPVRGVSWADFLLADVLTSLAKALSDAERAVCHLATGPALEPRGAATCGDASWVIPAGLAAPYAWRLMQCLRVHRDTGARAQAWNALKYATAFPVVALSAAKYHAAPGAWAAVWKPAWLAAALLNSCFSFWWDVERDWELGIFSGRGAGGAGGGGAPRRRFAPVLPRDAAFPRRFYSYLVASNAAARLAWTYKLSPHLRRDHGAVFFFALLEAARRFQWMFVRVEVELRRLQAARPELGQLLPRAPAGSDALELEPLALPRSVGAGGGGSAASSPRARHAKV